MRVDFYSYDVRNLGQDHRSRTRLARAYGHPINGDSKNACVFGEALAIKTSKSDPTQEDRRSNYS